MEMARGFCLCFACYGLHMLPLHPEIIDRQRISNVKIYKRWWRGWGSQVVGLEVTEVLAAADGTRGGFRCVGASLMSWGSWTMRLPMAPFPSVPKNQANKTPDNSCSHTGLSHPVLPCKDVSVFLPLASPSAWKSAGLTACGEENGTCPFLRAGLGCLLYNQLGRGLEMWPQGHPTLLSPFGDQKSLDPLLHLSSQWAFATSPTVPYYSDVDLQGCFCLPGCFGLTTTSEPRSPTFQKADGKFY